MSCGTKEGLVFGMGLVTGTGTTLYVSAFRSLANRGGERTHVTLL
jgi:hypothetical protein